MYKKTTRSYYSSVQFTMLKLLVFLIAISAACGLPSSNNLPFQMIKRSTPDVRIVGGHDADIADYPYQLSLFYLNIWICQASIIAPTWSLSSARCTDGSYASELTVRGGSSLLTGGQVIQVVNNYVHPKYDLNNFDYDVSVLELAEEFTVENASPIALYDSGFVAEVGVEATVSGWGALAEDRPYSDVLQVALTVISSTEDCRHNYSHITERMFCTGDWKEGGPNACDGDPGDPLVIDGKQYGVYSFSYGCGRPYFPGVYTMLTEESIRDFIRNITGL